MSWLQKLSYRCMWKSQGTCNSGRKGIWGNILDKELMTEIVAVEYNHLEVINKSDHFLAIFYIISSRNHTSLPPLQVIDRLV